MKMISLFAGIVVALAITTLAPSQSWAGQEQTAVKTPGSPFNGVWSGTWVLDHPNLGRIANGRISFRIGVVDGNLSGEILSSTVDYSIVEIANLQSGQLTEVSTPSDGVIHFRTPSGTFYELKLTSGGKVLSGTITAGGESSGPIKLEKQK